MLITENSHLGDIAARFLKKQGLDVKTLSHVDSAVVLCFTWFPDIVVVDLIDNGNESVRFLRELRDQGQGSKLPLLILAGGFDWEDSLGVDLDQLGVKGMLRHPFGDTQLLYSTIEEALHAGSEMGKTSDLWPVQRSAPSPSKERIQTPGSSRHRSTGAYSIQQARPQRRSTPPDGDDTPRAGSRPIAPSRKEPLKRPASGAYSIQQESPRRRSSGTVDVEREQDSSRSSGSVPVQRERDPRLSFDEVDFEEVKDPRRSSGTVEVRPPGDPRRSSGTIRTQQERDPRRSSGTVPIQSETRPNETSDEWPITPDPKPHRHPSPAAPGADRAVVAARGSKIRLKYTRQPIPESGELSDWGVAELIYASHAEGESGELVLTRRSRSTVIDIDQGSPCRVEPSESEEGLAAFLEQRGRLTTAQRLTVEAEHREKGLDHAQLLLNKGWVSPHELYQFLSEHATERLIDCFAWEDGDFTFRRSPSRGRHVIPLGLSPPRVIMTGISRHYNEARLVLLLPFSTEWALTVRDDGPVRPEAIHLNTFEARVLDLIRQGIQVQDLMDLTGRWTQALKVLYALFVMELVSFCDAPGGVCVDERRSTPSKAPRRPSRTSTPPKATEEPERPLTASELDTLVGADYFKLLGISRSATTEEIHAAFRTRVKRFQTDQLTSLTPADQERAAAINRRLVEGYQIIAKPKERKKYLQILEEFGADGAVPSKSHPGTIESFPPPRKRRESAPTTGAPTDTVQLARVQHMIDEERIEDAMSAVKDLKRDNPNDIRCLALYGLVLYLESPQLNLNNAQRAIGSARAKDPDNPWPYMMMARIREREESFDQAHELFLKARALAPRDGEVVDEVVKFEERLLEEEGRIIEEASRDEEDSEDGGLSSRLKHFFKKR